ncbi:hypothetical protein B0H14DRAFT_3713137 [Mycena olivaceomarginata]|nr:hypothetical protein B0H14DRAFT_3713137 [Mycena olivaceomarginata]
MSLVILPTRLKNSAKDASTPGSPTRHSRWTSTTAITRADEGPAKPPTVAASSLKVPLHYDFEAVITNEFHTLKGSCALRSLGVGQSFVDRSQLVHPDSPFIFEVTSRSSQDELAQYLERCLLRKTNVQDPEESGSEDDVMTESDDEDDYVERVDHRPTLVEEPDDLKRGKRVRPIPTVTRRTNGDKRAPRMIMTSKNKGAWNTELEDFGVLQYVVEKWALDLDLHFGWRELEEGEIIAGDQLTIARQRSILNVRLGHESGSHSWRHIVLMPGLFHAKIADCHDVLMTHFGKATIRSPGSLGFHNTVLDRLPITLTSLPPFRTCRDLIMVSLYSRVLHCLLLVSGTDSLQACADSITSYDILVKHARAIYTIYADADRVQELRERRIPEEHKRDADFKAATQAAKKAKTPAPDKTLPHIPKGDMVFENAVLFFRDALLTREFSDAIKAGDSGRVLIILRLWAFTYRGNGRSKYAHEMLHLLHNLTCVWTKELRNIVLQNWLANPQGKLNSFVEIDLVQEHLNFWIKKIYKADGDGHSWDWLALISPCVDILRQLATKINTDPRRSPRLQARLPIASDTLIASLWCGKRASASSTMLKSPRTKSGL